MPQIGGACNNENLTAGKEYKYGAPQPGNQRWLTNNPNLPDEVAVMGWWDGRTGNPPKPLKSVFRFKNKQFREDIAYAMKLACNNPNVGYSNTNRWTYESQVAKLPGGFTISNLSNVSIPCDTDCSMLVALCFKCVTGVNLGTTDTRHIQDAINSTKLCTELKNFSEKTQATGYGLQVGDICVWRETNPDGSDGYNGHTAIVVSLDDSQVPDRQVYIDTGITNIVVAQEDEKGIKLFGQNTIHSVQNSSGPLKLSFYSDELKKEVSISKIIAVDNDRIPRMIYGFPESNFSFAMIGDMRTMQLGYKLLGTTGQNYNKQFSFIDDKYIFAEKDALLMQGNSANDGILYINNVTQLTKNAANQNLECVNFWLGINDIFKYKDSFLGNNPEQGQTQQEAQDLFIEKWVGLYKQLVDFYIKCFGIFNKQTNKIYITSIVSTSKSYNKYFDGQGLVISKVNAKLLEYVNEVQTDWEAQGYDKSECWLQYIELNLNKNGQTYANADSFVSQKDFIDNFCFVKDWFRFKLIPKYNFNRFQGEPDDGYRPEEVKINSVNEMPSQIYKYFKSKGYSKAFSVGIIANMYQESGLNIAAKGDNIQLPGMPEKDYTSFGLCQWHNSSYSSGEQQGFGKDMKTWCSSHGGDWDKNTTGQLSWLLETMYNNSVASQYFSASDIQSFKSMKTLQNSKNGAEKIAELFVTHYEKPSNVQSEIRTRTSLAQQFWEKLSQE